MNCLQVIGYKHLFTITADNSVNECNLLSGGRRFRCSGLRSAAAVISAVVSASAAAHEKDDNEDDPAAIRSTKAIVHK